jgi:ElaB/YqjD/DUF883 family membrane-anchored ribosome-binding protein
MKATQAGVAGGDVIEYMTHKEEADSLKAKAHGVIDVAAERAKSLLAGMAEKSHAMTDKTSRQCDSAMTWMDAKRASMGEMSGRKMEQVAEFAKAKPMKALGLGLLAGVILGRLL